MRKIRFHSRLIQTFIWINALIFAFLLGGNLYEQWVIVPYWADDPPRTLQFWREIMRSGYFTFYRMTPLAILTAVIGAALSWRVSKLRGPLMVAAGSILLVLLITLVWAMPLLRAIFPFEARSAGNPADFAQTIGRLQVIAWVRWAVLFTGFAALLQALSRHSAVEAKANQLERLQVGTQVKEIEK